MFLILHGFSLFSAVVAWYLVGFKFYTLCQTAECNALFTRLTFCLGLVPDLV